MLDRTYQGYPRNTGGYDGYVEYDDVPMRVSPPFSPHTGLKVVDRDDFHPERFPDDKLIAVYASLAGNRHDADMLTESAGFDEVDSYYNPGVEEVPSEEIFEAIVIQKFARTEGRMAAVVRVFNKHLANSEIKALPAVVGKPKKAGTFAYVTVQIPFSDGQSVSIVFHAPEGDKQKITANDTIIAYRWLLNRRDITQIVAPENGAEVSLETLATKITQLVVKNSARFESTQKEAQKERQALDNARQELKDAEARQGELMDQVATASLDQETVDAQLANTLALLEKQKTINAELQAKLDGLRKSGKNRKDGDNMTGGSGSNGTETGTEGQTGTGTKTGSDGGTELNDMLFFLDNFMPPKYLKQAAMSGAPEATVSSYYEQIKAIPGISTAPITKDTKSYIQFRIREDGQILTYQVTGLDTNSGKASGIVCPSWPSPEQVKAVIFDYSAKVKKIKAAPKPDTTEQQWQVSKMPVGFWANGDKWADNPREFSDTEKAKAVAGGEATDGDSTDNSKFKEFISVSQRSAMNGGLIKKAVNMFKKAPKIGATEGQGDAAKVALHYFNSGSDWYIKELDPNTGDVFGWAIQNGDMQNAEYGYSNLVDLAGIGVELDLYWNDNTTIADVKAKYNGGSTEKKATGNDNSDKINPEFANIPGYMHTVKALADGRTEGLIDDLAEVGRALDNAADEAEKDGRFEEFEEMFNKAADTLTELLKKKQGEM